MCVRPFFPSSSRSIRQRVGRHNAQIIIEAADKEETLVTSTECGSFSVLCVLISNANKAPLKRHIHTYTPMWIHTRVMLKNPYQIIIFVYKI